MYFVQKIADAAEVLIELDMRLSRWVSNHGIHDFNTLAAQAISDDYGKELTEHLMYWRCTGVCKPICNRQTGRQE